MSLLTEALERQKVRHKVGHCKLAADISEMANVAEVVELLESTSVTPVLKREILRELGAEFSGSTLHGKLHQGCKCGWCIENFGPGGWLK